MFVFYYYYYYYYYIIIIIIIIIVGEHAPDVCVWQGLLGGSCNDLYLWGFPNHPPQ